MPPLHQEQAVDEALLLEYAQHKKVVALGETGLDFFSSPDNKAQQIASFRVQIRVAKQVNKPLIVDTRDVAKFVANLKGVSLEELAKVTTDNFFKLFAHAKK